MKKLFVRNFKKTKSYADWSKTAIECLNNRGLCQYCEIPELGLNHKCVMKYTVKNLLETLGKPKECKLSDKQINTYFAYLP